MASENQQAETNKTPDANTAPDLRLNLTQGRYLAYQYIAFRFLHELRISKMPGNADVQIENVLEKSDVDVDSVGDCSWGHQQSTHTRPGRHSDHRGCAVGEQPTWATGRILECAYRCTARLSRQLGARGREFPDVDRQFGQCLPYESYIYHQRSEPAFRGRETDIATGKSDGDPDQPSNDDPGDCVYRAEKQAIKEHCRGEDK